MEDLIIKQSERTPLVHFEFDKGELRIAGRVDPSDPNTFFEELLNKLTGYREEVSGKVRFTAELTYLRTTSFGQMVLLFERLKAISEKAKELKVIWKYQEEDESIRELGEDLVRITGLEIEYIQEP